MQLVLITLTNIPSKSLDLIFCVESHVKHTVYHSGVIKK